MCRPPKHFRGIPNYCIGCFAWAVLQCVLLLGCRLVTEAPHAQRTWILTEKPQGALSSVCIFSHPQISTACNFVSWCTAGNDDTGNLWLTSHLRLPHIFAAAELETLQQTLCKQGPSGTPFLLQPFVSSPNLVEVDPNPRLLTLGRLLTQGAKLNGSAKAAAVAATAIQHMMLVSVCRGFHTHEGDSFAVAPWCCNPTMLHLLLSVKDCNAHHICASSVHLCISLSATCKAPKYFRANLHFNMAGYSGFDNAGTCRSLIHCTVQLGRLP